MKINRQQVFEKYNGLCAYSGTPLADDWQVDHLMSKLECSMSGTDPDNIENLMPVQKIINHYKRALPLETFRTWYMGGLHERLRKLPVNPKAQKSIKRKEYLLKVAGYFGITPDKPFSGTFYFEKL